MLEVKLPLGHGLSSNNMPGIMLLDSLGGTNFHYSSSAQSRVLEDVVRLTVIGVQTVEICHLNDSTIAIPNFLYKLRVRESRATTSNQKKTRREYI